LTPLPVQRDLEAGVEQHREPRLLAGREETVERGRPRRQRRGPPVVAEEHRDQQGPGGAAGDEVTPLVVVVVEGGHATVEGEGGAEVRGGGEVPDDLELLQVGEGEEDLRGEAGGLVEERERIEPRAEGEGEEGVVAVRRIQRGDAPGPGHGGDLEGEGPRVEGEAARRRRRRI
jgi:hypothetical protein